MEVRKGQLRRVRSDWRSCKAWTTRPGRVKPQRVRLASDLTVVEVASIVWAVEESESIPQVVGDNCPG